jgi:hypothetical protein
LIDQWDNDDLSGSSISHSETANRPRRNKHDPLYVGNEINSFPQQKKDHDLNRSEALFLTVTILIFALLFYLHVTFLLLAFNHPPRPSQAC